MRGREPGLRFRTKPGVGAAGSPEALKLETCSRRIKFRTLLWNGANGSVIGEFAPASPRPSPSPRTGTERERDGHLSRSETKRRGRALDPVLIGRAHV